MVSGGISNGEHIYFNVPFKSAATISQEQETCTYDGEDGVLLPKVDMIHVLFLELFQLLCYGCFSYGRCAAFDSKTRQ